MTSCHVCERPCVREIEPAITRDGEVVLAAVIEPDVWAVTMRNGRSVEACLACWMKWPDAHKAFPAEGFGRLIRPGHEHEDGLAVLRETAA